MKLLVKLNGRNEAMGPADWPLDVIEVAEDAPDEPGRITMTRKQYAAYRQARRAAYEAWLDAQPEAVAEKKAERVARIRAKYEEQVAAGYRVPAGEHRGLRFDFAELERVAAIVSDDVAGPIAVSSVDEDVKVELSLVEFRQLIKAARAARLSLHQQAESLKEQARRG